MPTHRGPPPKRRIDLSRSERKLLRQTVRQHTESHRAVLRARIILYLYEDPCVTETAKRLGVDACTVRKWRDRFLEGRIDGLKDKPRCGAPIRIGPVTRCEIIAMACGSPSDFGLRFCNVWTIDQLRKTFIRLHPEVGSLSRTSVLRILNKADIRPHRLRPWLHSPDPRFREKVTEICELYLNPPPGSIVLCVDEKTGMQALKRKHPSRMAVPGRDRRWEFEYERKGTVKLLAAFNPHSGTVYGECRPTRTGKDLVEFMEKIAVMTRGRTVHVIWDNLNIHFDGKDKRWTKFNKRHGGRFCFHYTPLHASWVNQVELFFGIFAKRILRYGSFSSIRELAEATYGFIGHWNAEEAHPFRWTFKGYPLQTGLKKAA